LPDLQPWPTKAGARRAILEYIAWYNGTPAAQHPWLPQPAEFEETGKIKKVA
jgi:hypothetical protein